MKPENTSKRKRRNIDRSRPIFGPQNLDRGPYITPASNQITPMNAFFQPYEN